MTPGSSRGPGRARSVALAAVLLVALAMRTWRLDTPRMWADEAESAINALSIVEHGVPVDHYLGLPIYENTLTEPWPESAEYELRDSSYSRRGIAVYHGWIPLYAMAASFALAGVRPDTDTSAVRPQHGPGEMVKRTIAARAPSVAFGLLFVVLLFFAGRSLLGADLGWVAAVLGAVARAPVLFARQARYYSASAAVSVAAVWAIWRVVSRGGWRDFLVAGAVFVLLFHTHVLSFATACIVLVLALPFAPRSPRFAAKLLALTAIIGVGTLPWAVATGFFEQAGLMPAARHTIEFPADYLLYARLKPQLIALLGATIVASLAACRWPRLDAWKQASGPACLLVAWIVAGYAVFVLLSPAASFFVRRLTVVIAGPTVLLAALAAITAARTLAPRRALVAAAVLICAGEALLLLGHMGTFGWRLDWLPGSRVDEVIGHLERKAPFAPGTRFYSMPNDQLVLTFYTGLPVQSVTPVRRAFLDHLDAPIVLVDTLLGYESPLELDVLEAARGAGVALGPEAVQTLQRQVVAAAVRRRIEGHVASVETPPIGLPHYAEPFVDKLPEFTRLSLRGARDPLRENPAMFRGFEVMDWKDMWSLFFVRFVDPLQRTGEHANYAGRVRDATAWVLPDATVVYHCPPPRR